MMDINDIFDQAKRDMLNEGKHQPVLFAELATGGIVLTVFADFPYETTVKKQRALFGLGRKVGMEYPSDELRQVCLVIEAWTSIVKDGEKPRCAPSKDPNRKEALMATVLTIDSEKVVKTSAHVAEIVRAGGGVDLLEKHDLGDVTDRLLPAFFAGFIGARYTDAELLEIARRSL